MQRAAKILGRSLAAGQRRRAALEIGGVVVGEIDEDGPVTERQRVAALHDLDLRIDATVLDAEIEQALVAEDDIAGRATQIGLR